MTYWILRHKPIQIIGDITEEKLTILQDADYILREEIKNAGLQEKIWQYFTILPNMKSVGVMGDQRTYSYCVIVRGVTSIDGMTGDWAKIPYEVLDKISRRIVNEVNEKLPNYKHIKDYKILEEPLEKTTTQKIKRFGNNLSM